jgi:HEAT repeat protein
LRDWLRQTVADSETESTAAKEFLFRYCSENKKAIPAIANAIRDEDAKVSNAAVRFLAERPEGCRAAVPTLLEILEKDQSWPLRRDALEVVVEVAPDHPLVLPAVIRALREDKEADVRSYAAYTLRDIEPPPALKDVASVLRKALKDQDVGVRVQAAYVMVRLANTETAAKALLSSLRGENDSVLVNSMARSFTGLGANGVPVLAKALTDENANVRAGAALALGYMGFDVPDARPGVQAAVPAVVGLLKDKESLVRKSAASSLRLIGNKEEATVKALIDALADPDRDVRYCSADAIPSIGPAATPAVPSLIKLLKDQGDEGIRKSAARALGAIGPGAKSSVPALIEALEDNDLYVRVAAALALGKIGPEAKAAVPALKKALESDSKELQRLAAFALEKINKDKPM